jgi:hypothetical protein
VQIRIALFFTLSLCALAGCQQPQRPYGNFAGVESADLVRDALAALLPAYPPAKTRLNLIQPTEDMFGTRLVESLRGNGYAVAEYAAPGKSSTSPVIAEVSPGLDFGYILDALREGGELRVTLSIGEETLSRLYAVNGEAENARYVPVGIWMRKREGDDHAGQ